VSIDQFMVRLLSNMRLQLAAPAVQGKVMFVTVQPAPAA
jgi:hypothetical protein